MRNVLLLSCFVMMGSACSTLSSVKTNADAVKGAADDAKSQKDAAKGQVDDEKAKAMAAKEGGGGGGAAPAGATRLEASDGPLNQPISDKIDYKKGKINDWRKFTLVGGKTGDIATFILHWDEETANLDLDIFDQFGVKVGKSPPKLEGQSSKKILVRIDDPGLYYVKVSGPTKTDSSIYTMEVKWKGAPKPAVAAAPAPAPGPAPAPNGAAPAPAPNAAAAPCPAGMTCPPPGQPCPQGATCPPPAPDPNKVFADIVSVVHEGSTVTLYLDKGSSAGFRVGMQGTILDGPDGDKPLDGGTFTLSQVIGGSKSIAKSTTLQKPLGKNKRVVVNLK